ncbi:MAG TPA: alpha/beta hydrolase-fold protein [Puia sp.]|nr:alpha/beta hydrolase-fold protein [Puia sp.]
MRRDDPFTHFLKNLFTLAVGIVAGSLAEPSYGQQVDSSKLVIGDIVTIHSHILGEDRNIHIYTPALSTFEKFPGQPLPVLYLTDGDALSGIVSEEVNYLSTSYFILPPMIVVGITNYDHNRMKDLTPSRPKGGYDGIKDTSAFGGGEKFLQFISGEVMPYVESHYKTEPFKIFAGHSMGGLLAFHCLVNHPDLFNAYVAVSPSLWWDSALLVRQADKRLIGNRVKNKFLFFSDANEGGEFHQDVLLMDTLLKQNNIGGLVFKYVSYPDETHGSEPIKAVYDALRFIYPQWYPTMEDSTATLVKNHFRRLSDTYGYRVLPPEFFVARRGSRILRMGPARVDDAIEFFELNVANYPASPNAYAMLADAWAKKGDKGKAIGHYKKAMELDPGNKDYQQKWQLMKQAK